MDNRITATELARGLGDVLGRIRYRNESFLVERNGVPVARLVPVPGTGPASVRAALENWRHAAPADPTFADDLERVGTLDRRPEDPWGS